MLPAGVVIVAAIVVPYYAALYAQHGWDYITTFIVRENVARYADGVGAPTRGPLFYVPVLFADLYFPWSLVLPAAFTLVPWTGLAAGKGWRRVVSGGTTTEPASQGRLRLLLGLWIVLIVGFFSFSKGQQDLYVLPFVAAGAPLVGGVLSAWLAGTLPPIVDRMTRWGLALAAVVLGLLGVLVAWFLGGTGQPIHLAGAGPAGVIVALGAAVALSWLVRRRSFAGLTMLAATIIVAQWVLVVWALPDFERYKPVPQLARVLTETAGPAAIVGIYKVPTPSLVYYLRRRVPQMFDEAQLQAFVSGHPEVYCVMTDDDYEAVKGRLSVPLRVIARAPRFEARLTDFLNRSALPNLLLVTTRP
jgi:hypothetical protein